MGISISFSGRLRDPAVVPELIADVTARAAAAGWLVKTMDEMTAEGRVTCSGLRGITVYPHPQSEPLHLHFDDEGHFINHAYYALLTDPAQAARFFAALAGSGNLVSTTGELPDPGESEFFKDGSRHVWLKTQFAGAEVHAKVCDLLRHIKQRYAPELAVQDGAGYFETGDHARLEGEFASIGHLIRRAKEGFLAAAQERPKDVETMVERVGSEIFGPKKSAN